VVPIPEPSTMTIAGIGALGLIGYGLRRKALGA
jgi:LPXTG-motif cell wall-anchored protein